MRRYEVLRVERSRLPVVKGEWLYPGRDYYGVASTDTRMTGVEHVSVSVEMHGEPFFTIPREDVREFDDASRRDCER